MTIEIRNPKNKELGEITGQKIVSASVYPPPDRPEKIKADKRHEETWLHCLRGVLLQQRHLNRILRGENGNLLDLIPLFMIWLLGSTSRRLYQTFYHPLNIRASSSTMEHLQRPASSLDSSENAALSPTASLDDNMVVAWSSDPKSSGHMNIALKEVPSSNMKTSKVNNETTSPNSSRNRNPNDIPDSVLQFERQMRKAQHDKKVGKVPSQLEVVYSDEDIVVVNKPPSVLTVPGINQRGCILDMVHKEFGERVDESEKPHMTVHRLDMDTSGILLFGRTRAITQALHTQFRERHVEKEYRAIVMGHWPEFCTRGNIDLALKKDHAFPPFMRVATPQSEMDAKQALKDLHNAGWKKIVNQNPKPSKTGFEVIRRGNTSKHNLPYTYIRLIPITGRTHQLRVHCAALGFAIAGDPTYSIFGEASPVGGLGHMKHVIDSEIDIDQSVADYQPSLDQQEEWIRTYAPNDNPMCLHAAKLCFTHPTTNKPLCFDTEPKFDDYLAQF